MVSVFWTWSSSDHTLITKHWDLNDLLLQPCRRLGEASSWLSGWFFFFFFTVDGLNLASACCIWILFMPYCIAWKYIHRKSISGIYNCWNTNGTCKTIAILYLEVIPCTDVSLLINTHSTQHKITHTCISSCSLHAVPHIQGTKVREHQLMLKDLLNAHC